MIVEKKYHHLAQPFVTEKGETIENPVVAYEDYGPKDGPVIYIGHGGLSDQHAAGRYAEEGSPLGWWNEIIGEGKAIDTTKYRVICSNALGSMFGTSSPLSSTESGGRIGPDFPEITLIDMVRFKKAFLDELGVERLFMMAGPSMGSLQSLQMAALYPEFVGSVVAVATAGRMTPYGMAMHHFIANAAKMDPEFNDGWYEPGKPKLALNLINQVSRFFFTSHEAVTQFAANVPEGPNAQQKRSRNVRLYLTQGMEEQIANRDLNCYITIVNAINTYDLGRDAESYVAGVQRIKAPVLLMNITSDTEFPPVWAHDVADILNQQQPGQATVREIESPWGHLGCVKESQQLADEIREFIKVKCCRFSTKCFS